MLKILGNLLNIGSSHSDRKFSRSLARTNFNESVRQFDQQMNESITRRVADAKNAGVHPLFALGASVGASPTMSFGGGSSGSPRLSGLNLLMSEILEATKDEKKANVKSSEADAMLKNAQAAKIAGDAASRGRDMDPFGDATYYSPEIPKSKMPGVVAGERPGTIDIKMPDGRTVRTYDPDLGLDEISQINFAVQRARHYLADWLESAGRHVSDGAIIRKVKQLAGSETPVTGTTTPPNYRHRTRQARPINRSTRRN
jgi:hypothetical protein